jgi:hypothetical protein
MLARLPSVQQPYDDYYSGDPAFEQPVDPVKLERARETGDWSPLLIEGKAPTKFVMKPLSGDLKRKLHDRMKAGTIGLAETMSIAFRAAVVSIENFSAPFQPVTFADYGKVAPVDVTNDLDAIDLAIVNELGSEALNRAGGLSPKR